MEIFHWIQDGCGFWGGWEILFGIFLHICWMLYVLEFYIILKIDSRRLIFKFYKNLRIIIIIHKNPPKLSISPNTQHYQKNISTKSSLNRRKIILSVFFHKTFWLHIQPFQLLFMYVKCLLNRELWLRKKRMYRTAKKKRELE